ncbi:6895_t:CDS:2 [Dentiscutata erythropus]|uniref:6895_t:CDS:1 n=1 Tax=Dentiscutata erythropus TaxID=1348616 RepID=A0A9N9H1R5_9GLOM|nr:6895_t:CDS:2 [Dentiscutata erythropus]
MATVLTRTVASFFSNNGVIISKNIAKKGINIKEKNIVLAITEKKYISEFDENAISVGGGCECECEKCKSLNEIDVEKGMENDQYVYAICLTEMGLLDYIVYHHRTTYNSDSNKD